MMNQSGHLWFQGTAKVQKNRIERTLNLSKCADNITYNKKDSVRPDETW